MCLSSPRVVIVAVVLGLLAACGADTSQMQALLADVHDTAALVATQAPLPLPVGPVLFVAPSGRLPVTGGERNMAFLAMSMAHQGADVAVLARSGPFPDFLKDHGVRTYRMASVAAQEHRLAALSQGVQQLDADLRAWREAPTAAAAKAQALASWHALQSDLHVNGFFHTTSRGKGRLDTQVPKALAETAALVARAAAIKDAVRASHARMVVVDLSVDAMAATFAMEGKRSAVLWYVQSALPDADDPLMENNTQPVTVLDTVGPLRFGHGGQPVVRNGINMRRFHPTAPDAALRARLGAGPSDLLVGHVGYLSAIKDQQTLVRAMGIARQGRPHLRLVLVGSSAEQEYARHVEQAAQEAGMSDHMVHLEETDVPPFLNALDMFVFPSRAEGFGLALAEAMATALPCVVSDIPPFHALAGDAVHYVPVGEPQALADAIGALADDPAKRHVLGASARQRLGDAGLTLDRMLRRFATLLAAQSAAATGT